jgi:hypothetical protein
MPTTVTPVLSSTEGYLVDVRDQVIHLIRFLIMNPGGTSDIWEQDLISFRTLSSKYENSRSQLAHALEQQINNVLTRKFKDYSFDVECGTEDYNDDGTDDNDVRYAVSISVLINNSSGQTAAIVDGAIKVDKSTNQITVQFSDSIDNQTLS